MLAHHTTAPITVVGPYDVLCGRHKDAFNNLGNRRFRVTVDNHLSDYVNTPSRKDKSNTIQAIAELIKQIGGHFLKKKKSSYTRGVIYTELSEKQAYEKIGHAIRDMALANKNKGDKTTHTMSSLGRRKRALLGTDNDAANGNSPQPAQTAISAPDVACFQQQKKKKMVHSMRTGIERKTDSTVTTKPFCQAKGPFSSGLPMSVSLHLSRAFAGPEQAAVPTPIAFRTNNTTISMSPEDIDILVSCLNSNKTTSSVASVGSTSIYPEEFDVIMCKGVANLTLSTSTSSPSCSLSQSNDPLESLVGCSMVFPAAPRVKSFESLPWDDKTAFLDFLTRTSSSTFSAVTFSDYEVCRTNNTTSL